MKKTAKQIDEAAALRAALGFRTEAETAALLKVTVATLRNRQSAGQAPPRYKAGAANLYLETEIRDWLLRRRVHNAAA